MDLGYLSRQDGQVVDVKALWEGDLLRIPGFEKPRTQFDRTNVMKIENQRNLLKEYKLLWQHAIKKMDTRSVSKGLIHLVPILPCMFVDAYLKEHPKFHRDTLKAALAQLQEKGMNLRMDMLVDFLNMRENAKQYKIEEAIKIFFELKADMRSFLLADGTSVLTKAILCTKNKLIAEILLKNGAKFLTQEESYNMIRTICWQHENRSWFLQHKHQLLQAGLDVNAKDSGGRTVLESVLGSDSHQMEMALNMGVNPEIRDGDGRNIEEFYKDEVARQKYDEVKERMKNNMQMLRHHLLQKQMHGVYMRHAQSLQQGSVLTDVQRVPLDINEMILEHAYGKNFNS